MIAKFYRESDGSEPVAAFILGLAPEARAVINNQIGRLNLLTDDSPHLPHPHSSQVEGELRELRCHYGATLYRVLYRRSGQFIVLLHIFTKRTAKIPEAEKKIARDRWTDFKYRIDAEPRTPPRPIGHDAPG